MPANIYPDTLTGQVAELMDRSDGHAAVVTAVETLVFSLAGSVAVSTSGPDTPAADGTLFKVRCLLGTAGTSSTVVTVYVNGSSVGTVTLTSGQTNVAASFSEALTADSDLVTVGVTTAGSGAKDLTVLARVA